MIARKLLQVALPLTLSLVLAGPVYAQDAAADEAKVQLKQGQDQFAAMDFKAAKETLLKVNADSLAEADKQALADLLAKVDPALKEQMEARQAYSDGEKALQAGELEKAKGLFQKAADSKYVTAAEKKAATSELSNIDARIKAAGNTATPDKTPATLPAANGSTTPTATAPSGLANLDADRAAQAKELVKQGAAAIDNKEYDKAAVLLERAAKLDPANAEARKLLEQAQGMVGKPAADGTIGRLAAMREVARQMHLQEFDKGLKQAREAIAKPASSADFDAARQLAAAALAVISDNRTLFTAEEYRAKSNEANALLAHIATEKDAFGRKKAAAMEADIARIAAQTQRQQQQQKAEQIATLIQRGRTLESQMKYQQALEIYTQVLKLEPDNKYASAKIDTLDQIVMLREETGAFKTMLNQWQKQQVEMRQMEIPWHVLVTYPDDWRELSVRREQFAAQTSSESEADRQVRLRLKTRIPKLEFTNGNFGDVIEYFRTFSNVNFHVIWPALSAGQVEPKTPVTINLSDVTVDTALEIVLADLGQTTPLGYVIRNGVVIISTKEDLARQPLTRVYDIRDLLYFVPDFSPSDTGFDNTNNNTTNITNNDDNNNNTMNREVLIQQIITAITTNVARDSWPPNGVIGSISELHGTLVVTQTAEAHQEISNLIDRLREPRAIQICIEARFISVSSGFLNSIGLDLDVFFNIGSGLGGGPVGGGPNFTIDPFTGARVPIKGTSAWGDGKPGNEDVTPIGVVTQGGSRQIGFGNMVGVSSPLQNSIGNQVTTPALSVGGTFLDDVQVDFLVQATQANSTTRTLTAPRITLFNGQESYVRVGTQQYYVAEFEPIVSDNAVAFRPRVASITTGSLLRVRGTVSADRRYVTMTVRPSVRALLSLTNFDTGGPNGGRLQLPNTAVQELETTVNVPDKGTLLLGGQRISAEVEREGGVPGLSHIPVLSRLFTNRGKIRDEQTLLILIKPTIIIPREQEELAYPSGLGR